MPLPVHALAHRPLSAAAVAELLELPAAPHVPENFEAVDAEVRRRGWRWEHELLCDSFGTGHGHVLCTDGMSPFGREAARTFLVFGELYPVDPDDEGMDNASWLHGVLDDWQAQPGWSGHEPCTDQDCEAVLEQAAQAVTHHLGTPPSDRPCPPRPWSPGPR